MTTLNAELDNATLDNEARQGDVTLRTIEAFLARAFDGCLGFHTTARILVGRAEFGKDAGARNYRIAGASANALGERFSGLPIPQSSLRGRRADHSL